MKKLTTILILLISMSVTAQMIPKDKQLHYGAGIVAGGMGSAIASHLSDGDNTWTFIGGVAGSLLVGVAKEALDEKRYNGWDNKDLGATVLGGVTIGYTFRIFNNKKKRLEHEKNKPLGSPLHGNKGK